MTSLRPVAMLLAALATFAFIATEADARVGGNRSSGSRGTQTYSAPPSTRTAPNTAAPMERSMTQPSQPGSFSRPATPATQPGGLFNRPGLLGGLAAGFLGAGLLGLLFGNGLFGGLGGLAAAGGTGGGAKKPQRSKGKKAGAAASGDAVTSPMQGTIVKVVVEEGQEVAEGDAIVVIEAMKMEQPLKAHKAGTVTSLQAEVGQTVTNGAVICELKD